MTSLPRRSPPALRPRLLLTLAAAVGFGGLGLAAVRPHDAGDAASLREVRAAVAGSRAAGPRLSVTPHHRPCADRPGVVPRSSCAPLRAVASPDRRVLELAARASAGVRGEVGASSLHRAGLVDLLWSGEGGIRLDAAISSMEHAVRLSERPAPVLADLAGAFLLRAERDQSPRDVLLALEAAERALAEEPKGRVALFNRALALERLGLAGAAADSWRAYADADPRSDWGAEAAERARSVIVPPPPEPPAEPDAALADAFAGVAPQEALSWGLATALGGWAAAVLGGDDAGAERWLGAAEAAGARLARDGRDASLADAAAAARGSAGAERVALARAHGAFAEAAGLADEGRQAEAGPLLEEAAAASSPALAGWARLHRAISFGYANERDASLRVALGVAAEADSVRWPALAGRARWVAGTMSNREGRFGPGLEWLLRARPLLQRAGVREQVGGVASVIMETQLLLGDRREALATLREGLRALAGYETSVWLHGLLLVGVEAAGEEAMPHAALILMGEAVQVAVGTGDHYREAEARLALSRLLLSAGRTREAGEEIGRADSAVARLTVPAERAWFEPELRMARGAALLPNDAAGAVAVLDSAVDDLRAEPGRLVGALVLRADARAADADARGATTDLERASGLLDSQLATVEDAALRRSVAERARSVWDRLVMSTLDAGAPEEALARLERGRASFSPTGRAVEGRPYVARGEGALSYALIGDTLLVWALSGDSVRLARSTVDRAELMRTVERVRIALELRSADEAVRPELERLYEMLVRPVHAWLPPAGAPLRIVADGEISAVPFAALVDARRGRFLIDDHPLRFSDRLVGTPGEPGEVGRTVLLVADPAFDRTAHPGLGRLPGALAEVRAVATAYGEARVLNGSDASRERLRASLVDARVVHYAGHAVFDDARPERSYLVLAGEGERGRLSAEEVERMDLGGVRLVVLSACETVRAADGRAGGFAGFAGALLHAGAGGVVGSTWRVEDEATRRLMVDFHGRYRTSGDGAAALRDAQVAMLHSLDPAHRAIATWASFRYAGR